MNTATAEKLPTETKPGPRRNGGNGNERPAYPAAEKIGDEYSIKVPGLLGTMEYEADSVLELLGQTFFTHRHAIVRHAASLPALERVELCQALAFSEMVASRSEFVATELEKGPYPTALQNLAVTLDAEAYLKRCDAQPVATRAADANASPQPGPAQDTSSIVRLLDDLEDNPSPSPAEQAARSGIFLPATGILGEVPVPERVAMKCMAETLHQFAEELRGLVFSQCPDAREAVAGALLLAETILYRAGISYVVETFKDRFTTPAQLFARWCVAGTDIAEFNALIDEQDRQVEARRLERKEKERAASIPDSQ